MLKVKTYLKESTINNAGLGCFAAESILKGQLIWEFNPEVDRVFNEVGVKILSDIERDFVKTYSFKYDDMYYLCVDNARFFNHSIDNCNTYDPYTDGLRTYAARDINVGEELLSDYHMFGKTYEDEKFNTDFLK